MTTFSAWAGRFLSLVTALSLANCLLQPVWAEEPSAAPATEPLSGPILDPAGKGGEGGRSILAGWDKGFFLRSADKAFDLRITGQIQADYRAFLDVGDRADVDTFLVRRARLGI